jgi:hypothetical protein
MESAMTKVVVLQLVAAALVVGCVGAATTVAIRFAYELAGGERRQEFALRTFCVCRSSYATFAAKSDDGRNQTIARLVVDGEEGLADACASRIGDTTADAELAASRRVGEPARRGLAWA